MTLADHIWLDAIRELRKWKARKGDPAVDVPLDHLIRLGLIDKDEQEVSGAYQQMMRYSAVMAGQLSHNQFVLEKKVLFFSSFFVGS